MTAGTISKVQKEKKRLVWRPLLVVVQLIHQQRRAPQAASLRRREGSQQGPSGEPVRTVTSSRGVVRTVTRGVIFLCHGAAYV